MNKLFDFVVSVFIVFLLYFLFRDIIFPPSLVEEAQKTIIEYEKNRADKQ